MTPFVDVYTSFRLQSSDNDDKDDDDDDDDNRKKTPHESFTVKWNNTESAVKGRLLSQLTVRKPI